MLEWNALQWAYSPCPNDTFIFGALAQGTVPGVPAVLPPRLEDIATLNALAQSGGADVVKISASFYPEVRGSYQVLPCGGAMGMGVGPLLVAKQGFSGTLESRFTVAIPGMTTTANLLLSHFYPKLTERVEVEFSQIGQAVADGKYDLGLLIHEGRFTFREHGLQQVADLGALWETKFALPLPLGVILVRRELPEKLKSQVRVAIIKSLRRAQQNPVSVMGYVCEHAQELSPTVMQQHIALYVNSFSEEMGEAGKRALLRLWQLGNRLGSLTSSQVGEIFCQG